MADVEDGKGEEQIVELNRAQHCYSISENFFFSFNLLFFFLFLGNKVCTFGFCFLSNLSTEWLFSQVQIFRHFCFGGDVTELHMEMRCRTHYIPI